LCNVIFLGIRLAAEAEIDLGRPVVEWSNIINIARADRKDNLNLRIF